MFAVQVRTEYSFDRGLYAPLDQLICRLKALQVTTAAITDSDTWGHVKFHQACLQAGIKPVLGCVIGVTNGPAAPVKMCFLARNAAGLCELYQLNSSSYQNQVPTPLGHKPRITLDQVLNLSDNLLIMSGDMIDPVALEKISRAHSQTFFVDYPPEEHCTSFTDQMRRALGTSGKYQAVCVPKYNCILSSDEKTLQLCGEMSNALPLKVLPDQTADYMEGLCELYEFPRPAPYHGPGDDKAELIELCYQRAAGLPDVYQARLQLELDLITQKGFASYFLMVYRLVSWSKEQGILVGPGRGSAVGCLVCYLLGITTIDPVLYGISFERFISADREDLPDIDLDFPDNARNEVLYYLAKTYGADKTARIGSITTYKTRTLINMLIRATGIPRSCIPFAAFQSNTDLTLRDIMAAAHKKKNLRLIQVSNIAESLCKLQGVSKDTGTHASGVLIATEPLSSFCTVDSDNVAHLDKQDIAALGLLKLDVLSLSILSALSQVCKGLNFYALKPDDRQVFATLERGYFAGLPQFNGAQVREIGLCSRYERLSDIANVIAVARPGPIKARLTDQYLNCRRKDAPDWDPPPQVQALPVSSHYCLPIFQDDILQVLQQIGGFDAQSLCLIRRYISKGHTENMPEEVVKGFHDAFVTHAFKQLNMEPLDIGRLWEWVQNRGDWLMCKGHAMGYAMLCYWCAYAKTYYPREFACSILQYSHYDTEGLLTQFVMEGLEIEPPDVDSAFSWSVSSRGIKAGLIHLPTLSPQAAYKLHEQRERGQDITGTVLALQQLPSQLNTVMHLTRKFARYYENNGRVSGGLQYIQRLSSYSPVQNVPFLGVLDSWEESHPGGRFFLKLRVHDDSGKISVVLPIEDLPVSYDDLHRGMVFLFRARFKRGGVRYARITKIRCISSKEFLA